MRFAGEIRRRTEACQKLFTRCSSHPLFSELDWFENRQGEFNLWIASLKAANTGRSSLDYRVRDSLEVRELICDLLDGLAEALEGLLQTAPETETGLLQEPNDDVSPVFSDFSTDGGDTDSLSSIGKAEGRFSEQMFHIKTILGQLARISTAIRRSGATHRYRKADISLKKEEFEEFETHLTFIILMGSAMANTEEATVTTATHLMDPKQLTVVQKRLIRANIIRRNRIIFATRSMKPILTPAAQQSHQQPKNVFEVPTDTTEPAPGPTEKPTEQASDGHDIPPQEPSIIASSTAPTATEMGSQFNCQHVVEHKKSTPSVVTHVTRIGAAQDYPRCPKPTSDELLQCPYCADLLPTIYSGNQSRWRGHVAQDILPYLCIYEDCKTSDEMYLTSDDLYKHMQSHHGVNHWVCDYCGSKPEASHSFVFNCPEGWEFHMKTKHATFPPSQLPSLAKVSQRRMLEPLACPLCGYVAELSQPAIDDHIANHLHEFALRCLPWGTDGSEGNSANAKTGDASNSSELTDDYCEDGDPARLNLTEADTPTQIYKKLNASYFGLLRNPDPYQHPTWPYDEQVRDQLLLVGERLFKHLSTAEPLLRHQADQLTKQQSHPVALADSFGPAGFISPHEQSRMGKLRSYTIDPTSSFPETENKLLEILGSHLLKLTHILHQALLGWGSKRRSNAFELFCEEARPVVEAKANNSSANIKEELASHWDGLLVNIREEFQRKSELENENFEDYGALITQDCMTMLEDELSALDAALSGKLLYAATIQRVSEKDQQCLHHLRSSDPRDDQTRIELTKGGLVRDVYCWVLDNDDFRQFCINWESRLLWIEGGPGTGKTMMLCGIINELNSLFRPGLVSFFFCQATDTQTNHATAVLRGLVFLLVDQQPWLILHLRKMYDQTGKQLFADANAWEALSEILCAILGDPGLQNTYLIIDALDECVTGMHLLLDLVVQKSSAYPRVKWIVSSRNLPIIEDSLKTAKQIVRLSLELVEESVSAAVSTYIQHKVDELARLKQYDDKTRDVVQHHLTSNANDTFLWVALVCQELKKVPRWKVLTKLNEFPPTLGSLYQRMIDQIRRSDDADLCKQVLAVLSITYRPITMQELTSFVDIPEGISDDLEFLTEIVGLCGSFLTLRESTIYFVHQSAKDYLLKEAVSKIFPSGVEAVHYRLFSQSLNVMSRALRRDIYGLAIPGFPIKNITTPDPDPLAAARYACVYWVDHLCDCQSSDNIKHPDVFQNGGIIDDFLRQHYLHWLEALSLCRSMSRGIFSMAKLESILQRTITSPLSNLVYDMRRFVLYSGWLVENHPLQVYASALVFSPARSITRDLFKQEEPRWITSGSVVEDYWNACRQTLEGHSSSVCSVAFSPDSKLVVSGSDDNTVKIWDVATGTCTQTLEGHSGSVTSVAFSPDSKLVVFGSDDNTVKIWDVVTGTCTQTLEGHSGSVTSVAFSPDSKLVVSGSYDNTVKIWDAATGTCTQTLEGHSSDVNSVAFSPDSKLVVSGSWDQTVKIWDAATGTRTQTLEGHSGFVNSVAFSPDSKLVVSGSGDKTVKIWDVVTGTCTQTLEGHSGSVTSVAFSPDSKLVVSGSYDNTVKIWDAAKGTRTQTLEGHSGFVNSVAFSPDSKLVVSGSGDKTVKIWDVVMGTCTQTLEGHSGSVTSVAFSPDSKLVVSGSWDKTVKIWDAATGTCTQTLEGHSSDVTSVAFSPDSKLVVSRSYDNTVKIWDVVTGIHTQTLEGHSGFDSSKFITSWSGDAKIPYHQDYGIGSDGRWITRGSENWLWLPPGCRSACSAVAASTIAIGCSSGRVLVMTFATDN